MNDTHKLVNDLSDQVSRLVKDELRLAKLELTAKGKRAGLGAGLAGAAGVVAFLGGATVVAALVLLLALSIALTSLGGVAAPTAAAAPPAAQSTWDVERVDAASEDLLASLTNASRANGGLQALAVDAELVELARWRSRDMAERGYFSHAIPPAGTKVFDELSARGYCYVVAGENIGWLSGSDAGAEERIQQIGRASCRERVL